MNELREQIENALKSTSGRDEALAEALRVVLADFQSETGTIHVLDEERQLLHLATQKGLPPQMLEIVKTIPVGKGIAGQTVAQNEPVTICNLQTDASGVARPGAKQTGVGGALCVPMRRGEKIVGALGIGTVRPHEYTAEETRRLQEIADMLAANTGSR